MDADLFKYLWGAVMTLGAGVLSILTGRALKAHDDIRGDISDLFKDMSDHKLHVSETYAKDNTVQDSLKRVHDRIDIVSTDIKEILKAVKK